MFSLWSAIRHLLYFTIAILFIWTTVVSAIFIGKTEDAFGYHWNSASLLLSSSVIGFIFVTLNFVVHSTQNETFFASLFLELYQTLGACILWVLFLIGASDLSTHFPSGFVCVRHICTFARLTLVFAWVTWFALSWLLFNLFVAGITYGVRFQNHTAAWTAPYSVCARGKAPEEPNLDTAATPLPASAPVQAGQPTTLAAHATAPAPMAEG
ncbi:BQ2448_4632 [Microbotryum intermedium]|uniref:BQ2448_4632 protein n=1 Tax=Microbotryum intermedium TaxID=269621 RepID=A0A238FL79_9BASI|nr:BQ2448_4632 [Microbotryum intermedium]